VVSGLEKGMNQNSERKGESSARRKERERA